MRRIAAIFAVSLLSIAIGQPNSSVDDGTTLTITERGKATEVAPGITVIVDPEASGPLAVASEIYYYPSEVSPVIDFDATYTSFVVQLASKVSTRILIDVDDPVSLVPRADDVVVPAGANVSLGFVAFAAHEGVIRLLNEDGVELAAIPYIVTKQSQFQQSLSGFASTGLATDFDVLAVSPVSLGIGYGILERTTGIGATVTIEYGSNGSLSATGTISGSHTW